MLSASLTLGAALDQAVDRTVRDLVGRADLRVSGFLETGLSDSVRRDDRGPATGVLDAAAVIEHRTFPSGAPAGGAADAVTVLGIDPASYLRLHDLPLAAGSAPRRGPTSRVALDHPGARRTGTATGSAAR